MVSADYPTNLSTMRSQKEKKEKQPGDVAGRRDQQVTCVEKENIKRKEPTKWCRGAQCRHGISGQPQCLAVII